MRAVIQLRGEIDMTAGQRDTLDMLNIGRVNHAALVPEEDTYEGMISKVNDFVAHGEPSSARGVAAHTHTAASPPPAGSRSCPGPC